MERLSRAEAKARTRVRLLDAAADVFAEKGFAGAAVDEIAERAGFTVGALYSNFASKEDLFLALLDEHCTHHLSELDRINATESSGEAKIQAYARYFAEVADKPRDGIAGAGLRLELLRHALADQGLRERLADSYRRPRQAIAEIVADENFTGADRGDVATVLLAVWEGLLLMRRLDPDEVPESLYGSALGWLATGLAVTHPPEEDSDDRHEH